MNKIQFWKNGIMLGLVDETEKHTIIQNARQEGFKVYDNGHYFSVEKN